jgi:hypothetical protein
MLASLAIASCPRSLEVKLDKNYFSLEEALLFCGDFSL